MQDFKVHLDEQLDFLRSSIEAYDRGRDHEAKRLAVSTRTLVHDTKGSTSLLGHLGVKDQLGWIDRGPPEPPPNTHVIAFGVCVINFRFDLGQSRYEPAMSVPAPDRLHPPVSFKDWWRRPILRDTRGNTFCRADLVLALANQDGGAHIDAALKESYRQLSRENSLGILQAADQPIANSIVQASVRHIAEELLQTITNGIEWNGGRANVLEPVCPLSLLDFVPKERNALCPCGSGRKVKRCAGERKPLHVMQPAPADSRPGQAHTLPGPQPQPDPHAPPSLTLDCLLLEPVPNNRAA